MPFLRSMIKDVVETAMGAEMTGFLGYERYQTPDSDPGIRLNVTTGYRRYSEVIREVPLHWAWQSQDGVGIPNWVADFTEIRIGYSPVASLTQNLVLGASQKMGKIDVMAPPPLNLKELLCPLIN